MSFGSATPIEISARSPDQGRSQIPADEGFQPGIFANLADQRRDCALAVGAGDCHQRKIDKTTGQLQFADYGNSPRPSFPQQE